MMIWRALPPILQFGQLVPFPKGVGWFTSDWISVVSSAVTAEDVNAWRCSAGMFVKWWPF